MFYCLMRSGLPISKAASESLYQIACKMARDGVKRKKFKSDDAEGVITSTLNAVAFVSMGGLQFDAEIITPKGETTVRYFVKSSDIESEGQNKGEWSGWVKIGSKPKTKPKTKDESYKWN